MVALEIPACYTRIMADYEISLDDNEIAAMQRIAEKVELPFEVALQGIVQSAIRQTDHYMHEEEKYKDVPFVF